MSKIVTLEQAVDWCISNEATVKFLDDEVHVFLEETYAGRANTFIEAVDDAELYLYAEYRRSEALSEMESEE